MGTVGINFGSATSGQGFDVASTVTAIQSAQKSIEDPWNSQLTTLTAQDTALSTIGTDLASLSTSLQKLTDFAGVTAQKNGSSSDTTLVALTGATSTAAAGSHTVVINSLAQTSSKYTDPVTSTDSLSGSVTIQVGGGTAHTINVVSGTSDTLSTLSAAINGAGIGVSASVITDSTGSRLSLVSDTGGSAGQLTVTSGLTDTTTGNSAIAVHTGATGVNASLTVDGVTISSPTNTVSTAIPGVTFQLLATPAVAGTQVQIQITNDTASVSTAVSAFVTAYNAVAADLKTQEGKDASGNAEPLYGSPVLASIQTQLSTAIDFFGSGSAIKSASQFGINYNTDGTLSLNTDTLTSALTNNFSDVVGFLQNSGSFGQGLTATLNGLSATGTYGAIHVAEQQNTAQEATLKKSVANEDALLAAQKITLTAQLNLANEELQAIPSQINQVNEIYSAVTGYSKITQ